MPGNYFQKKMGPIAVHITGRDVRLMQLTRDHARVVDTGRWEVSSGEDRQEAIADAICRAREGRRFRGRQAVLCLGADQLHLQNIRIPKGEREPIDQLVIQEAASRIPFPVEEVELRHFDAADVRVSDTVVRELVVVACHRPPMEQLLQSVEISGLHPVAVETEPGALLRNLSRQFRRGEDRQGRSLIVHMAANSTLIMIAQGSDPLFVKYTPLGGDALDEIVAKRLEVDKQRAFQLRHAQDDELKATIQESIRATMEQLASELELCVRYHSVTFRGRPLEKLVLCGPEATPQLLDSLCTRLELPGVLSEPFARFDEAPSLNRVGQWDVASGLAQHEVVAT